MKRLVKSTALLMSFAMVAALTACGGSASTGTSAAAAKAAATTASATTKAAAAAATTAAAKTSTAASATTAAATGKKGSGTVTVYVAHNADQYNTVIQEFQEVSNIEVLAVSLGGGDALQRVAAEAKNPQCDIVWGPTTDSLEAYKQYFQPFTPDDDSHIAASFKDSNHLWTGESQQPSVLMYNKELVADADVPKTWEDLLDAKWKGKIACADPAASSSAYTLLCTAVMSTSKDKKYDEGWDFVKKLSSNLVITGGSSSVYKGVADGEYPIGLTLEQLAYVYVSSDPNKCGMTYLDHGTSNAPDGFALVKGCPDPDNAKVFMNFLLSKSCQQVMSDQFGRRTIRDDMNQPSGLPSLKEIPFIDYDFAYAGDQKADILKKWEDIATNVTSVKK